MVALGAVETVAMSIRSRRSSTVAAANSGNVVFVEVWSHPSIQMYEPEDSGGVTAARWKPVCVAVSVTRPSSVPLWRRSVIGAVV